MNSDCVKVIIDILIILQMYSLTSACIVIASHDLVKHVTIDCKKGKLILTAKL